MAIPVLSSGLSPAVDSLSRTLFGSTKYEDRCIVPGWEVAYNLGIAYCRKIAGSSSWSQHAHANALDISLPDTTEGHRVGDEIVAWLNSPEVDAFLTNRGASLAHILWRGVANHFPGHIHVDFNPYGTGTPSCAGGPKGPVVSPWPLWPLGEEDELSEKAESYITFIKNVYEAYGKGRGLASPGFWEKVGRELAADGERSERIEQKIDELLARP